MRPSTARRVARALLRPLLLPPPPPFTLPAGAVCRVPAPGSAAAVPPLRRALHATPPAAAPAPLEVRLPPLGESISEGAIAQLHVKPGDAVAEDAVLASVETDKVTVDVRAPAAGVVASVLVAEGESVTVGQLVVVLQASDGVTAAPAAVAEPAVPPPAAELAAPPPRQAPPPSFASTPVATPSSHHPPARRPAIKFPRRVTAAGARISSLPAAAQAAARELDDGENLLARLTAGRGGLYIGRERGTKLSRSRVLTDAEIEQIELGGAC